MSFRLTKKLLKNRCKVYTHVNEQIKNQSFPLLSRFAAKKRLAPLAKRSTCSKSIRGSSYEKGSTFDRDLLFAKLKQETCKLKKSTSES